MKYLEGHIDRTRRRLCSVMSECTVSEGLHLLKEDRVCAWCEKKVCIITAGRGACKILPLSNQYECPKIFQNRAQTPEHPKIHKHLIHKHL